jgi:hypothetical protein
MLSRAKRRAFLFLWKRRGRGGLEQHSDGIATNTKKVDPGVSFGLLPRVEGANS